MTDRRTRLRETVETALTDRDADAFVHVAPATEPSMRYCLEGVDDGPAGPVATGTGPGPRAVGITGDARLSVGEDGGRRGGFDPVSGPVPNPNSNSAHPAQELANQLSVQGLSGPLLTPRTIPHDAACYLEAAGFELASTDALERARAVKTPAERRAIERVQAAASEGARAAAARLVAAAVTDGRLTVDGTALTPERLRRRADEAVVAAGAYPAGNTVVDAGEQGGDEALPAGEPITIALAPRGPGGYHGALARTVVVDGDGGRERRAHVAATGALRSARAMLAGGEASVAAVAGDLEAEVMAFGFEDGIETAVHGVGLESRERPRPGRGEGIRPGAVVRLEVAVTDLEGGAVRLADLVVVDGTDTHPLAAPSRSLTPAALAE